MWLHIREGVSVNQFCIVILGCIVMTVTSGYAVSNSCITCHGSLPSSQQRAHDFAEWRDSIHARNGVNCEQCHGGNAATSDKALAHQGVVKSTLPASPLYFKRIADTCGKCHPQEAAEYKKSFHARELGRSGRGPNCTTCHGSMATHVLSPQELEQTCSLCHSLRPVASEALVTLNQAGMALKRWRDMAVQARDQGQWTPDHDAALNKAEQAYHDVQRQWHSLDMQAIITQSRQIISRAKQATQSLKLKMGPSP